MAFMENLHAITFQDYVWANRLYVKSSRLRLILFFVSKVLLPVCGLAVILELLLGSFPG